MTLWSAQMPNMMGMNNNASPREFAEAHAQAEWETNSVRDYNLSHEETAVMKDCEPGRGWNWLCDLHPASTETVVTHFTGFRGPRELDARGVPTGNDRQIISVEIECPLILRPGNVRISLKSRAAREVLRSGLAQHLRDEGWFLVGLHECFVMVD